MKKRLLKNIDWGILICSVTLVIIGLVALMSATQNTEYEELKKLAISVGIKHFQIGPLVRSSYNAASLMK